MKIDRNLLLAQMIDFFQAESGVIVGDPGVGKSYLLTEMLSSLLAKEIPATMVRLDFLTDGTNNEIAASLGISGEDWIEPLRRINIPEDSKAVIIFDAFDTIKDEKLKKNMLTHIAKARRGLPGWSVVVSVRTYDAARSQKLIELFPSAFNADDIHCRRFNIPILSAEELDVFLAKNERLNAIYQGATQRLKDVLKIPFFLALLEMILDKTSVSKETLIALKSEIELLDMYWVKVVYNVTPTTQTELFLRNFTLKMVNDRVLSVDKLEYLDGLGTDKVLIAEQLLSENVITEQGTSSARIAFAHNIIFDFAVSKLLLKDSTAELLAFIQADTSRPFFLRPSFVYFFARLWYTNPTKFWEIYNAFSQHNDDIVSLLNKLVPSTVLAREFDEATPLDFTIGTEPYKIEQISNVLQALRFLKNTNNKIAQVSLLLKLSYNLQLSFAWDFAFILEGLVDDAAIKADSIVFAKCGKAARNLMDFLMDKRSNQNVDQLASYRGTSLITKTYATDVTASRSRLEVILDMLKVPDFNIAYFTSLTGDIKEFYLEDPEFCARIYQEIYTHQENSSDPTPMHAGVLLSVSSNRRDQFHSCQFRLQQFFPLFIRAYPDLAIPLGLTVSNLYIRSKSPGGFVNTESIKTPYDFTINGVEVQYQVDMSHFWSEFSVRTDPIEHVEYIINYFETLLAENKVDLLHSGMKTYCMHATSAYIWKKLLSFGAGHPELTNGLLFDLLLQPAILYWNDTSASAVDLLGATFPFYTKPQLAQIETAILSLPTFVGEEHLKKADLIVARLLSRIPKEGLTEARSIEIIESAEHIPNEPDFTMTFTSEILTTEICLTEKGIDIEHPDHETLLAQNNIMESFNRTFPDRIPDPETYDQALLAAIAAFAILKDNSKIPEPLAQTLLTSIASVCEVVLRSNLTVKHERALTPEQISSIKDMVLYCLAYYCSSDRFAEENSSPGSVYSPTPRSEAAPAIVQLYSMTKDTELLSLVKQYACDMNSVTRFGIIKNLNLLYSTQKELFWDILNERLGNETDWLTKATLISKLGLMKIFSEEQDRLIAAFQIAKIPIFTIPEGRSSHLDSFLSMALEYYRETNDFRIIEILDECLDENLAISGDLVFQAFKIIEPANFYRHYSDEADIETCQKLLGVLMNLLKRCEKILLAVKPGDQLTENVTTAFNTIDNVVSRINFSMQVNKRILQQGTIKITDEHQERFYFFIKPLLEKILEISRQLDGGHMQGHTAHYFIETMGAALRFDARFSLATTTEITKMTTGTNYTFDHSAIQEVVKYTETLLADHKNMLTEPEAFAQIMTLLNLYVRSGWPQSLELLWKLDDVFR